MNEYVHLRRFPTLVAMSSASAVLALAALGSLSCTDDSRHQEQQITLSVTVRSPSDAVVLEWSGGPPGVRHWQYAVQTRDPEKDRWVGGWRDVPRKRTRSNTLDVFGLEPGRVYVLRVRPVTRGDTLSDPIDDPDPEDKQWPWLQIPERGADGIVHADWFVPLHGGDVYRLGSTPYVFTVPREGSWEVSGAGATHYWSMVVEHLESDAALFISPRTGAEDTEFTGDSFLDRARTAKTEEERNGYRLLGEILDSVRYAPEHADLRIVVESDGEVRLQWRPLSGATFWEYRAGTGTRRDIVWGRWRRLPADATSVPLSAELHDPVAWDHAWHFEVRPWTHEGPGAPRRASFDAERALPDGVPQLAIDRSPRSAVVVHAGGRAWRDGDYVFDVPPDMLLRFRVWGFESDETPFGWTVRGLLIDETSGSYLLLNRFTYELLARAARPHPRGVDTEAVLDDLHDSIRYSPAALSEPLLALTGLAVGEVLLAWKPVPNAQRWQYRHRDKDGFRGNGRSYGDWSSWVDVPGSDAGVSSVRVTGLEREQRRCHNFEVRPWTANGPGRAASAVKCVEPATTDVPRGSGLVESGGTYQACRSRVVFTVPAGVLTYVRCDDTVLRPIVIMDVASGSWLYLGRSSGAEVGRYIGPHTAGRDVDALFDRIAESARSGATPP